VSDPAKCVFCKIVRGTEPADIRWQGAHVIAFTPLNPHVPGHILFVPRVHVKDATENLAVTAMTMEQAACWASGMKAANIITSIGRAATQSIGHLHIHVIPRGPSDGLRAGWPWK
jgi:histidine triad (HIT) family protein